MENEIYHHKKRHCGNAFCRICARGSAKSAQEGRRLCIYGNKGSNELDLKARRYFSLRLHVCGGETNLVRRKNEGEGAAARRMRMLGKC